MNIYFVHRHRHRKRPVNKAIYQNVPFSVPANTANSNTYQNVPFNSKCKRL